MKNFLTILVLSLFLITPSWADDIRDYQIEGMSIGDSALDYFTKEEIKARKTNYYKNNKFTAIENNYLESFEIFDFVDFNYKTNDRDYIIQGLSGIISYKNNIKDCDKKMDEIVSDLSKVFKEGSRRSEKKIIKHSVDKSGKSITAKVTFWFDSGNFASVNCHNYSEETGYQDHLNVSFKTKEFNDFLKIAYD